jgi:hypothetical protein
MGVLVDQEPAVGAVDRVVQHGAVKPDFDVLYRTGVSQLCGGGVPGCQDGGDLFGSGVSGGTAGNAGADQDPAELGEHVLEGGLGLGPVPGFGGAAAGDAGRVVAVPGVPHHDQGADEQGERDGALDGAAGAVAGLAGAQDVAGVGEGLLDGLITNGKFCCVRWVRLSLSWWHRPLRLRESALQRCRPGRRAR